jgi:homopolymeric O-antigen transport system ATP-binding protein
VSSIAIQSEGLGKQYEIGAIAPYRTLRESLAGALGTVARRVRSMGSGDPEENRFWALRDVSFDVKHGEVIGVIGRNGAGKSTLLKLLSRITWPTEGRASIHGRVGALLEVGTGFHPELTGRENIFLNGAIMGMRKTEIAAKFDEIVAFSGVEKFIDTAVKHYSSGMYVRLAFAIAAHLEPEILIIDEVLAVGDLAFQQKCLGKMSEVSRGGRTILVVSHNMAVVEKLCERCIILDAGRVTFQGETSEAVHHYLKSMMVANKPDGHVFDLGQSVDRQPPDGKLLKRMEFYTDDGWPVHEGIRIGGGLKVKIHFDLPAHTRNFDVSLGFDSIFGQRVFNATTLFEPNRDRDDRGGPQVIVCDIPSFTLMPGTYNIRLSLDINQRRIETINQSSQVTVLESDYYGGGKIPWNGVCVIRHNWYLEPGEGAVSSAGSQAARR